MAAPPPLTTSSAPCGARWPLVGSQRQCAPGKPLPLSLPRLHLPRPWASTTFLATPGIRRRALNEATSRRWCSAELHEGCTTLPRDVDASEVRPSVSPHWSAFRPGHVGSVLRCPRVTPTG